MSELFNNETSSKDLKYPLENNTFSGNLKYPLNNNDSSVDIYSKGTYTDANTSSDEINKKQISAGQKLYLRKIQQRRILILCCRVLLFVLFLLLWEVSTRVGWIDSFIFSSPSKVVSTFLYMWTENQLYLHIGVTVFETLVSFFIVVVAGIFLAIMLWSSSSVSAVFEPYLVLLNSLPKSALAPLLIVWLGTNISTIIVAGISVSIFGTIIHLYTSFRDTDPDKIKLVQTLGGNRMQVLTKVVLPSSIPQILGIMKVNIGLCLVGVIIGEFIGSRQGLGHLIIYGTQVFKLDWVILSIVILCIVAILLYGLIGFIEKIFIKERSS